MEFQCGSTPETTSEHHDIRLICFIKVFRFTQYDNTLLVDSDIDMFKHYHEYLTWEEWVIFKISIQVTTGNSYLYTANRRSIQNLRKVNEWAVVRSWRNKMTLSPKIITTSSHPQNRGACDWWVHLFIIFKDFKSCSSFIANVKLH